MAFSKIIIEQIRNYCSGHLADDSWYENEFSFINETELFEENSSIASILNVEALGVYFKILLQPLNPIINKILRE